MLKDSYELKTWVIVDRMASFIKKHEYIIMVLKVKRRKAALEQLIRISLDMDAPYNRRCSEMIDHFSSERYRDTHTREKRKHRVTRTQREDKEAYQEQQRGLEQRRTINNGDMSKE